MSGEHVEWLRRLGVPACSLEALEVYLALVATWNTRTNLTAARTAEERARVLVADALRAMGHLRCGTVIDVGSGNGSPGLVLALLQPELRMTLLEPRGRRWAFLREAIRRLDRDDIQVERVRCQDFGGRAQTTTVRAVGLDLQDAGRLVDEGGEILVFGGRPEVPDGWEKAGAFPLERSELHVLRRRVVSRET